MKHLLPGYLLALGSATIYGTAFWWIALATQGGWGNFALTFSASFIGTIFCLIAIRNRALPKLNPTKLWAFLRIGLSLFAANICMFLALRWEQPSIIAFFAGLQVLWVSLIELLSRQLRWNWGLGFSLFLSILGTLFINEVLSLTKSLAAQGTGSFSLGEILGLLAGILFGLAIFFVKQARHLGPPLQVTLILNLVIVLGSLILLFATALFPDSLSFGNRSSMLETLGFIRFNLLLPWLYPLILGLGNFFGATLLQIRAQKQLSGSQVGMVLALQPIPTILMGLLFFQSTLNQSQMFGGALLISASLLSIASSKNL